MADVWFIGRGKRTISAQEWLPYGVVAEDVCWSASNGWSIPESEFSFDQLAILDNDENFRLGMEGPRLYPRPASQGEMFKSGYIYYARIMEIWDKLLETGADIVLKSPPYVRFSSSIGMLGVTATDRAYDSRVLIGARMRVASAPQGSDLVAVVQHWDGFSWTDLGTLTIANGSVIEAVISFDQEQNVGNLVRCEVTSVGSTSAATGVAIDVMVESGDYNGDGISSNGAVFPAYTTGMRPTAVTTPGTGIYDSTLNKPLWTDGADWRDAMGNIV